MIVVIACSPKPAPQEPIKTATPEMRRADEMAWPRRVSGSSTIVPDAATQAAIAELTPPRVTSTWSLCMDKTGTVTEVDQLASTGFKAYDAAIRRALLSWRYEPTSRSKLCKSVGLYYPAKESD